MSSIIKKYADDGDISKVRITFLGSLDVDPTFEEYKEDFEYCKTIPGVFEAHREMKPLERNSSKWDNNYWIALKMDMKENFSLERFNHMREVAKILYADKIAVLLNERKMRAEQKAEAERKASEPKVTPSPAPIPVISVDETPQINEKAVRRYSVEREVAPAKNPASNSKHPSASGDASKKVMGIAIAVVAILAVILLILLLK